MDSYNISSVDGLDCLYCGEPATDRDHVIPFSATGNIKRTYLSSEVVPACKECNSHLYNLAFHTIADRAAYLAKQIAKDLRKFKHSPWTKERMNKLGKNLRQYVQAQEYKRVTLQNRLEVCKQVSELVDLTPSVYWEVHNPVC